jgi:integrase
VALPADRGEGHFVGVPKALGRLMAKAELSGVTPHVLRHSFASIAGDLGFSELTIAGLLGHAAGTVTAGYVQLDAALVAAAIASPEWSVTPLMRKPKGEVARRVGRVR